MGVLSEHLIQQRIFCCYMLYLGGRMKLVMVKGQIFRLQQVAVLEVVQISN